MSRYTSGEDNRLRVLGKFSEALISGIRLGENEILGLIHSSAKELFDTSNMFIAFYDDATDTVRFGLAYVDGKYVELGKEKGWQPRKAGKGKTEEIIRTGKPLFHPTKSEAQGWYKKTGHKEYVGAIMPSWMGVAMRAGNKVLGVIATYHPSQEHEYNKQDLDILQSLANQAAVAIENSRLYHEARSEVIAAKQLATLGTAIAALQHRINNTLNIIIPNIKRLRSRVNVNDPTIKEILDIIERNARYTSDLLMRIQTPLQEVESSSVNVNSLVDEIAQVTQKEWDRNPLHPKIKIVLNLDDSIPLIQLPIGQVSEIVRNLLDNAHRAMKKGGKLIITSSIKKNSIYIRIKDTAEGGIPSAIRERLFQKPVPSKEPGQGAGLGLWLSKLMLQGIGGDVIIEETGPAGTTMLLCIPVSTGFYPEN